jgi:hypothetical protein
MITLFIHSSAYTEGQMSIHSDSSQRWLQAVEQERTIASAFSNETQFMPLKIVLPLR